MTAKISTCTKLRVVLDAAPPRGVLAAAVLAAEARLPLDEAVVRLSDAPGELTSGIEPAAAHRLVLTLRLFGLRVRAEPADGPRQSTSVRFDLALQWSRAEACPAGIEVVAERLGCPLDVAAEGLASPSGLILSGQDWAAVCGWRQALRRVSGLRLVVSDPQAALYDLLPLGQRADSAQAVALLLHLRRLGIAQCPMTGAVGTGLDLAMRDHVLRRFPRAGFVAVNQDFQRFDLLLTGVTGLDAGDLDGFLRTRGGLGRRTDGTVRDGTADPLRIECALGRTDALAFQSDYAAIGIDTRLRLVWPHAARMS
jgi:hypothetical protein